MKTLKYFLFLITLILLPWSESYAFKQENSEKEIATKTDERNAARRQGIFYYVDPVKGKEKGNGSNARPFKDFAPLTEKKFRGGETIVVAAGTHENSLILDNAAGTKLPITVKFLRGKHIFKHGKLFGYPYQISNTNDRPNQPKAVAIKLQESKNVKLTGETGAEILMEGKTIYFVLDRCDGVTIENLTFDYLHPTMGEFKVVARTNKTLDAKVPEGIQYEIKGGKLFWKGPGWSFPLGGYIKIFDAAKGTFSNGSNVATAAVEELSPNNLRFTYSSGSPDMQVGQSLQNRDTTRDCVGFFQVESKNIVWKNCNVHCIHGMGVVSQFSENIAFDKVNVVAREDSIRTNVTWADILHFSGCKGKITVTDCVLSAAHDDAINVHGTHLRVAERVNDKTIVVRFMHPQTFGFNAFYVGDEIEFVHGKTLQPFGNNIVEKVKMLDERRIELTCKNQVPKTFEPEDAVENITWTPALTVKNVVVKHIPTRGFLVTTRKPVVIEGCKFYRTGMSAILVEDDASGWYESGPVKDMQIRKNEFTECAEPVININPHVLSGNGIVHSNIRITGNKFKLSRGNAISSHHSKNVLQKGNKFLNGDEKTAVNIK